MILDFSYRCVFSFLIPILVWIVFGNQYIKILKGKQANHSTIRDYVPESHMCKKGTPTMGGVLIIFSVLSSCVLFGDISNKYFLLEIGLMIAYFFIGFCDDFFKVYINNTSGLTARLKFFLEIVISFVFIYCLKNINGDEFLYSISLKPFFDISIYIGVIYFIFAILVISGTSNAVNLTDGLDGLVAIPSVITYILFSFMIYVISDSVLSDKFSLEHIQNTRELLILLVSFIGSILGFFIFNKKPARIFMGDSGSLPIGAVLGGTAVILKGEILLLFAGIVFVIEALSVIIQVVYFRCTGKRFFLIAPIHHHFEKMGYSENRIVHSVWGISFFFNVMLFVFIFK